MPSLPPGTRDLLLARDGRACSICGQHMPGDDITVEHVVPRSVRPDLAATMSNLRLAHRRCNAAKGASLRVVHHVEKGWG